uniref:Carrier domain-containing protein n=1 Tax=Mucochytrium quahogii TaxID=96639 RepID=A0A7S2SC26_9STRA|mmetsp:Transcript_3492/g.7538  ORF Transcript_3492/g.7538 Transcript_3492/m.7538 type:complete len:1406 (+) Transcript_3492:736-4953(+)
MSLVGKFYTHVNSGPHKQIYYWLGPKGEISKSFTRCELWNQSGVLAQALAKRYAMKRGDRAMIVFPFGIDFLVAFLACMRLGVIVVSVYPPNPKRLKHDMEKLQGFVKDCQCNVVLTIQKYKRKLELANLKGLHWVGIDGVSMKGEGSLSDGEICGETKSSDIVLIQYTSGSTGDPKGVMVSNENLIRQMELLDTQRLRTRNRPDKNMRMISWVPQYHDMGLIGCYLLAMYNGGETFGISPRDFLANPILWPDCLKRYQATITTAPNFGYSLTCKRLQAMNLRFDLPNLTACSGAEPCDLSVVPKVQALMGVPPKHMFGAYGLAEHVLVISHGCATRPPLPGTNRWSMGSIAESYTRDAIIIKIVQDNKVQEDGTEGEIWVASRSVAQGYWGRDELSKNTYRNVLEGFPGVRFLRTGDLGVIHNDNLYVCGRIKDLIILNGKNILPNDVEQFAESVHPEYTRPGCSVAFQATPTEIVLVMELRPHASQNVSIERLGGLISTVTEKQQGVIIKQVVFVPVGTVPKTTSGKVRRNLTKQLWEANSLETIAISKRSSLQNCKTFRDLLQAAGVEDWDLSLGENGIDSVQLVQLTQQAASQFNHTISSQDVERPCRELVERVEGQQCSTPPWLPRGYNPVTDGRDTAPALWQILLGQSFVVVVLFTCICFSASPVASLIYHSFDYSSPLWVINGRISPICICIAIGGWAIVYSIVCILAKWLLIFRLSKNQVMTRWSWQFTRYWTVQRLTGVWHATIGIFCSDTILLTVFYNLLGAKISWSARISSFFYDWDLVNIGDGAEVDGNLYARIFHGRSVHFGSIEIGQFAKVGTFSVIQPQTRIGNNTVIEAQTLVSAGCRLTPYTRWQGVPCRRSSKAVPVKSSCCKLGGLLRITPTALFVLSTLSISVGLNYLVPPTPVAYHLETWSQGGLVYICTLLLLFKLVGIALLAGIVLLKWSFTYPYGVDRMATLGHFVFFPYAVRNYFALVWLRLFGLKQHRHACVTWNINQELSASKAHLVKIERGAFIPNTAFGPETDQHVATTVWEWIRDRSKLSPWSYTVDITIPENFQSGLRSRIESGCVVQAGAAGIAPLTRISKEDTVKRGQHSIGNPIQFSLAKEPTIIPQRKRQGWFSALLDAGFVAHYAASVLLTVEVFRSIPFISGIIEVHVAVVVLVGILFWVSLQTTLVVLYKWALIGGSKAEHIPFDSCALAAIVFVENLHGVLWFREFGALFAGLVPSNLYHRLMGCKLDITTVLLNEGTWVDPTDDVSMGPWTVADSWASINGHIVTKLGMRKEPIVIHREAIVHPYSLLHFGSLGANSSIYPLSRPLAKLHIPENQCYTGLPAQPYQLTDGLSSKGSESTRVNTCPEISDSAYPTTSKSTSIDMVSPKISESTSIDASPVFSDEIV